MPAPIERERNSVRRITAIELNQAYSDFLTDQDEGKFYSLVSSYVEYVSWRVPPTLRPDLVQNIMVEIFRSIARFKQGADFARWVNGVTRNVRMDAFRASFREQEQIVSGVDLPEDHLEPDTPVDPQQVRHQLDAMAAALPNRPTQSPSIYSDKGRPYMRLPASWRSRIGQCRAAGSAFAASSQRIVFRNAIP